MNASQLKAGYLKIYKEIYSLKNIFRRLPCHQRMGYLLFNLIYRKYGKITERICDIIGFNRIGYLCARDFRANQSAVLGKALKGESVLLSSR